MLVENSKHNTGDIINLKLISGDEIIGELANQSNGNYELRRPCIIVTSPEGIGFLTAMFGLENGSDQVLTYKNEHIISVCATMPKMAEHYRMMEQMQVQEE